MEFGGELFNKIILEPGEKYFCYKYGDVGVEIPKVYRNGENECLVGGEQYRFCEMDKCPIWIMMHRFPESPEELEWHLHILAQDLKKEGIYINIEKGNVHIKKIEMKEDDILE